MVPISEHYGVIENNIIVNVVVCDNPAYAKEQRWLPFEGLDPMPWIGWTWDGSQWNAPIEDDT